MLQKSTPADDYHFWKFYLLKFSQLTNQPQQMITIFENILMEISINKSTPAESYHFWKFSLLKYFYLY